MNDLPSPDRMKPLAERLRSYVEKGFAEALAEEIVVTIEARASGRLVDRETINYEAAAQWTHAEMVRRGPTNLTWEAAYPEEQADHLFLALGAIGAALGDDKTVEELRAAAFGLVDVAIGDTE